MKIQINNCDNGIVNTVRYCSHLINADLTNDDNELSEIQVELVYAEFIELDDIDADKELQYYKFNNSKYYTQENLEIDIWEEVNKFCNPEERDDSLYRNEIHNIVEKIGKEVVKVLEENKIMLGSCE